MRLSEAVLRDGLRQLVDHGDAASAEARGHALRWLGEEAAAREAFGEAADRFAGHPALRDGSPTWVGAHAGMLLEAHREREAVELLEGLAAVPEDDLGADARQERVLVLWLLGDPDGAAAAAAALDEPWELVGLIAGARDAAGLRDAQQRLARMIEQDDVAPWQAGGGFPLTLWGWLHEVAQRLAALEGGRFDPAATLRAVGLWDDAATPPPPHDPDDPGPDITPWPGRWSVDGATLEVVDDDGLLDVRVDLAGTAVTFGMEFGEWVVELPGGERVGPTQGFRAAADAAAEHLDDAQAQALRDVVRAPFREARR
jgi:hypothetical protein